MNAAIPVPEALVPVGQSEVVIVPDRGEFEVPLTATRDAGHDEDDEPSVGEQLGTMVHDGPAREFLETGGLTDSTLESEPEEETEG